MPTRNGGKSALIRTDEDVRYVDERETATLWPEARGDFRGERGPVDLLLPLFKCARRRNFRFVFRRATADAATGRDDRVARGGRSPTARDRRTRRGFRCT